MYKTRLMGTAMLVLTLAAVLSTACTKSNDNAGTTGTSGTGIRVSHIDLGRSVSADKTIISLRMSESSFCVPRGGAVGPASYCPSLSRQPGNRITPA